MGIHSISNFITAFKGGTRPNRFIITASDPTGTATSGLFVPTHCVAATLPESIVGIIPIPFRGRVYKFPGDRSYNEWNVTVLDDQLDNDTWFIFHEWSQKFNSHVDNIANKRDQKSNYCVDLTVTHYDHASDAPIRTVYLRNAWPVQVGPVTLDMNAANQLTQFQVQIAYTHFEYEAYSSTTP
jgi:hypothetical protein